MFCLIKICIQLFIMRNVSLYSVVLYIQLSIVQLPLMKISLQINLDRHHQKTNTWDKTNTYFLQPPSKRHHSPKSLRQDTKVHKRRQSQPVLSNKKSRQTPAARNRNTQKKSSGSKPKLDKNYSTVKKIVNKGKKDRKRVQHSQIDYEQLRGTLPGLSGKKVLQRFQPLLSQNQRIELINQKTVYYVGVGTGTGQDDLEGRYLWHRHQQVGYRYQLLQGLGRGAFGEVVRAYDHKTGQIVAVKIVRSGRQHMQLALNQINILMKVKEQDIQNRKNILRIKDFIVFRKHICIITQLLAASLYQLMQAQDFKPIDMNNIRAIAIQLLLALAFLKQLKIVHSDIKPQNVLMKNRSKVGIKLIDFGTSMFLHQTQFLYIQSRFYRSPQVILGAKYGCPIDMWSLGCLLAELHLGCPLFAGDNQQEQMSLILRSFNGPSQEYLQTCKHTSKYFNKDSTPKIIKGKNGKALLPMTKPLQSFIQNPDFCCFLQKILRIEPQDRLTPLQALIDPWVLEYFPQDIRKEHVSQILLKIKKEQGQIQEQNRSTKIGSASKGHRKRNSEIQHPSTSKHRRRGSQGFF